METHFTKIGDLHWVPLEHNTLYEFGNRQNPVENWNQELTFYMSIYENQGAYTPMFFSNTSDTIISHYKIHI